MGFSIAVLISGGGTTLRNLIEKRSKGQLSAYIELVISSSPQAKGLRFADDAGIETVVVDHHQFRKPAEISDQVFSQCRRASIDLVVMGGFLRKVVIPRDFVNRVVNIHPSLIPAFCGAGYYGMRVHEAVIRDGALISGCTVHFVDDQFDHGPIIAQESLQINENETPQSLASRIFELECELYPRVINAIAEGRIEVHGRRSAGQMMCAPRFLPVESGADMRQLDCRVRVPFH